MHDQLLNAEVANLQRAEFLRETSRHQAVDREPRVRESVVPDVLGRLGHLLQSHRRLRLALHH